MAYGRTRSRLGRGFVAASVVLAILAALSNWRWVAWDGASGWGVNLLCGTLTVRHINSAVISAKRQVGTLPLGWTSKPVTPSQGGFQWWLSRQEHHESYGVVGIRRLNGFGIVAIYVTVALWPVPVLLLIPGLVLWRRGRRISLAFLSGRCLACGYDRRGLPAGACCPECGGPAPTPRDAQTPRSVASPPEVPG